MWGVIVEYVDTVVSVISNLGFPIACVVAMFWQLNKERENHKAELDKMTEALNNNTIALTKISAKLGAEL